MKLLITIFLLSIIVSSEAKCSTESWTPVPNLDIGGLLGRWFAVLRTENGEQPNCDCLWQDLKYHPTIPGTIYEIARRTFKNGKNSAKTHRKQEIEATVTFVDPTETVGIVRVAYKNGSTVVKYLTAVESDEFAFVRVCHYEQDYFWAYSRNQYPSNSTLTKIYEEMDRQGIDKSTLIRSCTDVRASEII